MLATVLGAYDQAAQATTDAAVRAFLESIGKSETPSDDEINSAMVAVRTALKDRIFHRDTLRAIGKNDIVDDRQIAKLRLEFRPVEEYLQSPQVVYRLDLPPTRLALSAFLGAIAGALIGSPIGIYLLTNKGDVGTLVGAALGAFISTWAIDVASRFKWLSNSLIAALGLATVAEVWAFVSTTPIATIWRRLCGRTSLWRVAVYCLLIALLKITQKRKVLDRTLLEQSVRHNIEHWLPAAYLALGLLINQCSTADERQEDDRIAQLGKRIIELHHASTVTLSGVAQDVIDAARNAGFEGLDEPADFCRSEDRRDIEVLEWSESMRERYNVFGHIEAGDIAQIEQHPVVFRGEVREKGLVRKQRGR